METFTGVWLLASRTSQIGWLQTGSASLVPIGTDVRSLKIVFESCSCMTKYVKENFAGLRSIGQRRVPRSTVKSYRHVTASYAWRIKVPMIHIMYRPILH